MGSSRPQYRSEAPGIREALDSNGATIHHAVMNSLLSGRLFRLLALLGAVIFIVAPGDPCVCLPDHDGGIADRCTAGEHPLAHSEECPCGCGCGPCIDMPLNCEARLAPARAPIELRGPSLSLLPFVQPAALELSAPTGRRHDCAPATHHDPPHANARRLILIV